LLLTSEDSKAGRNVLVAHL